MAASPSSGIEQGRFDAPADSGATTTTSLTFETLPLTPPGKSSERLEEEATSSVTSSSSPFSFSHGSVFNSHAPLPPPPPTLSFPPYAPSVRGETGGGALLPSAVPGAAEGGGGDQVSSFTRHSSFHYASDRQQSRILSPVPDLARKPSFLSRVPSALARNNAVVAAHPFSPTTYFGGEDWTTPPPQNYGKHSKSYYEMAVGESKTKVNGFWINMVRIMRPGSRPNKRLLVLIILNFAYSTAEFLIGLFTGRIGLVSDSFHLTFGCGVLAFSLYAMMVAEQSPSDTYTYGYKRLEVLAAFTNALFLLFLSFSLAVEALHAFVEDESEHKHYLIISAVTNLLVNLLGVWFFRSYARVHFVYRKSQDMNHHAICLHVLSDSIRSAGVVLASWLLTFGIANAETICLGLVAVTVFFTTLPLFKAAGGVLLQVAPSGTSASALNKCLRQVRMDEDVTECCEARFWEMVPGSIVGTLLLQVREGADEQRVLKHVHSIYNDIGVKDLTVEIEVVQ